MLAWRWPAASRAARLGSGNAQVVATFLLDWSLLLPAGVRLVLLTAGVAGFSILAFKRIRNILGEERPGVPSADLYREQAERRLATDFLQARPVIERLGGSAVTGRLSR